MPSMSEPVWTALSTDALKAHGVGQSQGLSAAEDLLQIRTIERPDPAFVPTSVPA